ncbi:MAG: hypothetical protein IKA64_02095 [Clostridia bacterium]|nr:hypothetical protein [Clostridia bacterium]
MREDVLFKIDGVSRENLEYLAEARARNGEARYLELADIASALAAEALPLFADGYTVRDVFSMLLGAAEMPSAEPTPSVSGTGRMLSFLSADTDNLDKVVLAELIISELHAVGRVVSEADFLPSEPEEATVTYVRNALSDEAFDVFAEELSDPRVVYADSLTDSARAVSAGEVSYCLLPLEERGGVRLAVSSELMLKYDLKINSVTPVFGLDGGADLKYALLSRSFRVPSENEGDDRYLEIRLFDKSTEALTRVLDAAAIYGSEIYRVNTVALESEGERELFYSLVLRTEGDFTALLTYLTAFCDDFAAVGIYKNLE